MPNCFSNVIGIKEACTENVSYKLFINQLGINLKLLDQYAGSNYKTGLDLFNEKLEFAGEAMASEMLVALSKRIKGNGNNDTNYKRHLSLNLCKREAHS